MAGTGGGTPPTTSANRAESVECSSSSAISCGVSSLPSSTGIAIVRRIRGGKAWVGAGAGSFIGPGPVSETPPCACAALVSCPDDACMDTGRSLADTPELELGMSSTAPGSALAARRGNARMGRLPYPKPGLTNDSPDTGL